MNVRPSPEMPVPVSTIVTLHPKAQRLPAKHTIVQRNLPRKNRIRMRSPRKPNPPLTAQLHPKRRSIPQIPRNPLPPNLNPPPAPILPNPVLPNFQEKWTSPALAQTRPSRVRVRRTCIVGNCSVRTKTLNGKSLNPSLRLPFPRKPSRPNLHRLPLCIPRAPASSRIHQQIPEPPSPAPITQPHPQKPNLIPPPHRQLREHLVERLHTSGTITLEAAAQTSDFSKNLH